MRTEGWGCVCVCLQLYSHTLLMIDLKFMSKLFQVLNAASDRPEDDVIEPLPFFGV